MHAGDLIRLVPIRHSDATVTVASCSLDSDEEWHVESGSFAVFLGKHHSLGQVDFHKYPVVLVGNKVGWVFSDEISQID